MLQGIDEMKENIDDITLRCTFLTEKMQEIDEKIDALYKRIEVVNEEGVVRDINDDEE
jgi:chaperonin cofactor prefoldin